MAVVKCKECGGQVSTKAAACPGCGAKMPKRTSVVTWAVLVLIIIAVIASCGPDEPVTRTVMAPAAENVPPTAKVEAPAEVEAPVWRASSTKDAMTDELTEILRVTSDNAALFDFPYKIRGGSKLHLTFRKTGDELDAYLRIDKGQMMCSYSSCNFNLRVGEGPVQAWTGLQSTTNDSDIMFVRDAKQLESIVKRGGKIRIGIEFHQEGIRAFDFDVSDYPGF